MLVNSRYTLIVILLQVMVIKFIELVLIYGCLLLYSLFTSVPNRMEVKATYTAPNFSGSDVR